MWIFVSGMQSMDLNKLIFLKDYFEQEFKDIFVVGPVGQIHVNESEHASKEGKDLPRDLHWTRVGVRLDVHSTADLVNIVEA